jgi:hypothetical protein
MVDRRRLGDCGQLDPARVDGFGNREPEEPRPSVERLRAPVERIAVAARAVR